MNGARAVARFAKHRRTLSLLLVPLLLACGEEEAIDEAGARTLWDEIQAADYTTWARAPGWEERQETVRAHGQTAEIFVNGVVRDALGGNAIDEWPAGSVVVKDSYRGEEQVLVAAMQKRAAGWFFAEWSAAGSVKYAGLEIGTCTGCHDSDDDRSRAYALP